MSRTRPTGAVRLITFDIMGTLMKPKLNIGKMYLTEAKKLENVKSFRACTPAALDMEFRKAFKHHWANHPNFGFNEGFTSMAWWRNVVRDTFLGALERTGQGGMRREAEFYLPVLADNLFGTFSHSRSWAFSKGDADVLKKLRQRFTLGVISNFDERLIQILNGFKIADVFSFIVISKEVGVCKPDAEIFDIALHRAGLRDPADALHVGDNLELDYLAAQRAGWRSVWFHPVQQPNDAAQVQLPMSDVISTMDELLTLPAKWSTPPDQLPSHRNVSFSSNS
ncbi:haloacid dehalogenase-like hydrolase domain-containing protein 3 [Paramacrobiotus metropolitanus]|uniref:haloacid dehalogenase-like hydrolase domain-containing protein 3 n=1 Tax=Paramacrobiotus metropolitanus TaxID=2943436 RepID=UPI0024458823|nr:haloacid dehalogenase-like hydrolase domain-containing protein 3 [Paramacrobiotus metropolitanus]